MSTSGTAVVIDVGDDATLAAVVDLLQSAEITTDGVEPRGDVYVTSAPDGRRRVTAYLYQPGIADQFPFVLAALGAARVAAAEDFDEYGALWTVEAVEAGAVRTVHRRYVLNADPADAEQVAAAIDDLGEDPRERDVAGDNAAAAAAVLFGVDPAAVVVAERGAATAYEELGTVGGPFPWWDALALPWPQPGAGTLVPGSESYGA